jgi:hypothetical protein
LPREGLLDVRVLNASAAGPDHPGRANLQLAVAKECSERQMRRHGGSGGAHRSLGSNNANFFFASSSYPQPSFTVPSIPSLQQGRFHARRALQGFAMQRSSSSVSSTNTSTSDPSAALPLADPNADLASLWSVLTAHLSDLSSPLHRGLLSSFLDASVAMEVADLSGLDSPASPRFPFEDPFALPPVNVIGSDVPTDGGIGISTTVLIVIGVLGGAALILVVAVVSVRVVMAKRGMSLAKPPSSLWAGGHTAVPTEGSPSPEPSGWGSASPPAPSVMSPLAGNSRAARTALAPVDVGIGFLSGSRDGDQQKYAAVASASPVDSVTGSAGSSAAHTPGTITPATTAGLSNASSRRSSDASSPATASTSAAAASAAATALTGGGWKDSILSLPPGLPRGSIIQHVRVVKPTDKDKQVSRAAGAPDAVTPLVLASLSSSPSPSPSPEVPSVLRRAGGGAIAGRASASPPAAACASPSALLETDVLNEIFDNTERR